MTQPDKDSVARLIRDMERSPGWPTLGPMAIATLRALQARVDALEKLVSDHEEAAADNRRLEREMAVAIDGEDAAKQPALCDVLPMVRELVAERDTAIRERDEAYTREEAAAEHAVKCMTERDTALAASGAVAAEVREAASKIAQDKHDAAVKWASHHLASFDGKTDSLLIANEIRSLPLPTAPSAALAQREDEAWNEAIEAAVAEVEANWGHVATPELRDAIRALKRSAKE